MPPRSAPVQSEAPTANGAQPRVETYSASKGPSGGSLTKRLGGGTRRPRNQQRRPQQQRFIPKGISNSGAVQRTRNTTATPLLASANQPASLGDSYDYSVPSTAEESKSGQEDQLQPQQSQPLDNSVANTALSPYGNSYGGYGGGYNSMMMPPMMYGGYGGMQMGPFSGLYQVLYGVQNVVFSISQAVQLVGMNQQVLQQSWESLTKMVDHAIATFHEMRALERHLDRNETEEDTQRRKRLKALRYALVMGGSWLAYKIIRHLLFYKKNRRRLTAAAAAGASNSYSASGLMGALGMSSMSPYSSSSYYGSGGGGYSPYSSMNNNMFNGGAGYGYSSGFY